MGRTSGAGRSRAVCPSGSVASRSTTGRRAPRETGRAGGAPTVAGNRVPTFISMALSPLQANSNRSGHDQMQILCLPAWNVPLLPAIERDVRALLVLALLALAAPAPSDLPRGKVVERIGCAGAPGESYALYLPAAYTAGRAWPIL